jgi:hypothetical protein
VTPGRCPSNHASIVRVEQKARFDVQGTKSSARQIRGADIATGALASELQVNHLRVEEGVRELNDSDVQSVAIFARCSPQVIDGASRRRLLI